MCMYTTLMDIDISMKIQIYRVWEFMNFHNEFNKNSLAKIMLAKKTTYLGSFA